MFSHDNAESLRELRVWDRQHSHLTNVRLRSRDMKWLIQSHGTSPCLLTSDFILWFYMSWMHMPVGSPERKKRADGVWPRTVTRRRGGGDGGIWALKQHSQEPFFEILAQLSFVLASFSEKFSLCLAEKRILYFNTYSKGSKTDFQRLHLGMCSSLYQ